MIKAKQIEAFPRSMYDTIDNIRNYALEEINSSIDTNSIISIQEDWDTKAEQLTVIIYYKGE